MNTRRSHNTPVKQGLGVIGQQKSGSIYAQQQQQKEPEDVKPDIDSTQTTPDAGEEKGKRSRPDWQTRKANPELRRLRQNARVKKVVKPKTAIMVLHEMFPDIVYKIDEVASNKTSIYRVHFEMENRQHSGEGFSKTQAKQYACENALKTLLTERLAKEQEADKIAAEKEKNAAEGGDKNKDADDDTMETDENERKIPVDDFPWGKLASFAMQKLMDSWTEKSQSAPQLTMGGLPGGPPYGQTFSHPNHTSFSNYTAPPNKPGPGAGGFQFGIPKESSSFKSNKSETSVRRPTLPRKKFPENPLEYNPVALYNQTWPNIEPTFDSSKNAEGQPVHTATLTLEGFRFSALGKSKKEVKLQLSKALISTLKGVKYPDGFTAQVMQA